MSRTITLHPASFAVGALFAGIAFLTMSQSSLQAPMPLRVEYLPHPREFFRIEEGTIYTVPTGKVLVLAGAGTRAASTGVYVYVTINGAQEFFGSFNQPGIEPAPAGLTYGPGTAVQVFDGSPSMQESYAVAYLAAL